MTVENKTPYTSYNSNGSTKTYTIPFYVLDKTNFIVKINGVLQAASAYSYNKLNKTITFNSAPAKGASIAIERRTPLVRSENYDTYTNKLRPEAINAELDKVWYSLQEHKYKVDQYDIDYTYATETATQALEETRITQARVEQAYNLALVTNTEIRPISTGGTGASTTEEARTNLDVYNKQETLALIQTGGAEEVLSIANGGTGATTVEEVRANLDVLSATESRELSFPLGIPLWHNGTEVTIPTGHLPYNGQVINRADHPAFWEKIQSTFALITEAEWLVDPKKRGCYSSGDGSTTFRMPDLNGYQTGSIKAPVLRGDGNGIVAGEAKSVGQMDTDAIRELGGTAGMNSIGGLVLPDAAPDGVFYKTETLLNTRPAGMLTGSGGSYKLGFKASNVVPTAPENRMNSVYGIWICRVGDTTTEVADPTEHAVLTGGNTFNGSQKVIGDLEVTGNLISKQSSTLTRKPITLVSGVTYTNTKDYPIDIIFKINTYEDYIGSQANIVVGDISFSLSFTDHSYWITSVLTQGGFIFKVLPNETYTVTALLGAITSAWEIS